ncbi:MAG: hypothetical protein MPL62_13010 [Alphaproteobacteria bacterium]|nr:hypothetical protein [Alphaproteobacteria bacterium]
MVFSQVGVSRVGVGGADFASRALLTAPRFCPFWTSRGAIFGISGRWTKTFTVLAQAGGAGRWVRASPQN